jgi:riboflavin kinase / FMN adenylyltransferase
MQVIHGLSGIPESLSFSAVAIGNFDGVHLGHHELLSQMVLGAKSARLVPTVLTFYPHPVEVLNPQKKLEQITTTAEKLTLMETLGVQFVCVAQFDKFLSELSAEDFFTNYLVVGLKAKAIFVGFNFRFGKNREGDIALLTKLCQQHQIALTVMDPISLGDRVSSSLIRQRIMEGKIEEANRLLGRKYSMTGTVKAGDGRGSQLGFPTANLDCPSEKVLPKNGVYVTRVKWQFQSFKAITNVGVRPTFHHSPAPKLVEVHILDLNAKLYDESLELEFLGFVRDEQKFSSVETLKSQIQRDIETARHSPLFDTI